MNTRTFQQLLKPKETKKIHEFMMRRLMESLQQQQDVKRIRMRDSTNIYLIHSRVDSSVADSA